MRIDCANPVCEHHMRSLKLKTGFAGSWEKHGADWYCSHRCYFQVLADQFIADGTAGNHKTVHRLKLGLLLLKNGIVDNGTLQQALDEQANSLKKLGEILIDSSKITHKELNAVLSMQAGVAVVNLAEDLVIKEKELIPFSLVKAYPFVCCGMDRVDKSITIAVDDIDKMGPLEELFGGVYPGFLIKFYITERSNLMTVLSNNYPGETFTQEPPRLVVQRWREDTKLEQLVYSMVDFLNGHGAEEVDIDTRGDGVRIISRLQNNRVTIDIHRDNPPEDDR